MRTSRPFSRTNRPAKTTSYSLRVDPEGNRLVLTGLLITSPGNPTRAIRTALTYTEVRADRAAALCARTSSAPRTSRPGHARQGPGFGPAVHRPYGDQAKPVGQMA